jgi:hypothetical protein
MLKKSSKKSQNPSRYYYYNSITNLKLAKISPSKNPHIKINLLPRGLKMLILYNNESKHDILSCVGKANKAHYSLFCKVLQ